MIGSSASGRRRTGFSPWLDATVRTGSDSIGYNIDQQYAAGNLNFADPSYSGAFNFLNDYRNENEHSTSCSRRTVS